MWIYNGTSLQQRLRLTASLGFWLDYWLLLHADDTYMLWACRPLGLQSIARIGLDSDGSHNKALRRQLKLELKSISNLAPYLPAISFPANVVSLPETKAWPDEWLKWFHCMVENKSEHLPILYQALARAICANRATEITFLTRRIAAELADKHWSRQRLLSVVKRGFCDSGLFTECSTEPEISEALQCVFSVAPPQEFEVEVHLAPSLIGSSVSQNFARTRVRLITKSDESSGRELAARGENHLAPEGLSGTRKG